LPGAAKVTKIALTGRGYCAGITRGWA